MAHSEKKHFTARKNDFILETLLPLRKETLSAQLGLIDEVGLGKRVIFNPPYSFYLKISLFSTVKVFPE